MLLGFSAMRFKVNFCALATCAHTGLILACAIYVWLSVCTAPDVHADAGKCSIDMPVHLPVLCCFVCAEIGELLLHRVIAQFKRAYKRNDKPITIAAAKFLAHLINQGVLHEVRVGRLYKLVSCGWLSLQAVSVGQLAHVRGALPRA
jgi:hypothetical protein